MHPGVKSSYAEEFYYTFYKHAEIQGSLPLALPTFTEEGRFAGVGANDRKCKVKLTDGNIEVEEADKVKEGWIKREVTREVSWVSISCPSETLQA